MALTLYYHPLASYCHKVLIALYEAGTPFTARLVDLGNPEDRATLASHWALCKFPVIHDGARSRSLPESTIIIEYLDRHFPGGRRMIPDDPEAALDVRLWDRILDTYVHAPMQEIVGHHLRASGADTSVYRSQLEAAYRLLDGQLAAREWVAGEGFSLADCAAAPALFYASTLVSFPGECVHLGRYFDRLTDRPSVRRTIDEAKPFFHFYPFADAIPARFR